MGGACCSNHNVLLSYHQSGMHASRHTYDPVRQVSLVLTIIAMLMARRSMYRYHQMTIGP
jgi:hypothetical protein